MAGQYAIEADGLAKRYGAVRAVDGVDLRVREGSITAVLGPNGAGKTTALRMLATLVRPDAGSARVFGHDVVKEADAVRRRISLTGQFASVDDDLTGVENLKLLGRLMGLGRGDARQRADELLGIFGIADAARRQVKKYSGGMRRRIDIAASIIVAPDLLFLDEPTTGLDPRARAQVWDIVRVLVEGGTTVLLTTQYLEEADQLADTIIVFERGKVIASGSSAELKAMVGPGTLRVVVADPARMPEAGALLRRTLGTEIVGEGATLTARVADAGAVAKALGQLAASGIGISDIGFGRPSLDEVFLALTGRLGDAPAVERAA